MNKSIAARWRLIKADRIAERDWHYGQLARYEPSKEWHLLPMTERQRAALARQGYDPHSDVTRGEAAFMIGRPTARQVRVLVRAGMWDPAMPQPAADAMLRIVLRDIVHGFVTDEEVSQDEARTSYGPGRDNI